ncbi:MAG: DUF3466 family protein [Microcoleaceae cyanobacterium MO_207.B10]|nr:DUF3466 family protein [Microcoleaceae cyanobacterium MO_207.B10]
MTSFKSQAQTTTVRLSDLLSFNITKSNSVNAAYKYHVTDLGTLGGSLSLAKDINKYGQIVGYSINKNGEQRAFVWDNNQGMQDIGTLGGDFSCAYGINDYGQVVGYSVCNNGQQRAFIWDATKGIQSLNTQGEISTEAYSINNLGQVVGLSITSNGQRAAFIWDSTKGMQNIGIPGEVESSAYAINNYGQVVGYSISSDLIVTAFTWNSDKGTQELPGFLGSDINSDGYVVGFHAIPEDSNRAFVYDGNKALDLGTISGDMNLQFFDSQANSINNSGLIVGYSDKLINFYQKKWEKRAFISDTLNNIQDLNDLVDPASGWILREAESINDNGQIVGWGSKDDCRHGFLLTPISHQITNF